MLQSVTLFFAISLIYSDFTVFELFCSLCLFLSQSGMFCFTLCVVYAFPKNIENSGRECENICDFTNQCV